MARPVNATLFLLTIQLFVQCQTFAADEETVWQPKPFENRPTEANGWSSYDQIVGQSRSYLQGRRISAVHNHKGVVWVGTSFGQLLRWDADGWTEVGHLEHDETGSDQITGIAIADDGIVWLSTSDGVRQLTPQTDGRYAVRKFLTYYQGHPAFVSGPYMPGVDAVRRWGYVDNIFIPNTEPNYSPFVISTEHGLFSWTRYGIWHHFLPHYWGANSPWLDTRELVPHRRPTAMVEDADGNVWIGTDGDGLIRMNAAARKYLHRDSDDNERDGTEFGRFGADEIGVVFDRVASVAAHDDGGVVCSLASRDGASAVASFDNDQWRVVRLNEKWTPLAVVARDSDAAWVGVEGDARAGGGVVSGGL